MIVRTYQNNEIANASFEGMKTRQDVEKAKALLDRIADALEILGDREKGE